MEFRQAQPNELMFRLVDTTGTVEMGVGLVIYGFRVRAGRVGSSCYDLDWCAGAKQEHVEILYSTMRYILEQRAPHRTFYHGLPGSSRIKPFFNDWSFCAEIASYLPDGYEHAKLPDVAAERKAHQERLHIMFPP